MVISGCNRETISFSDNVNFGDGHLSFKIGGPPAGYVMHLCLLKLLSGASCYRDSRIKDEYLYMLTNLPCRKFMAFLANSHPSI